MSVIDVARNPTHHDRTKHIHVRFHFIRSLVGDRLISLHHCQTDDQLADIFTKPLGSNIHGKFRERLGCACFTQGGVLMLTEAGDVTRPEEGANNSVKHGGQWRWSCISMEDLSMYVLFAFVKGEH